MLFMNKHEELFTLLLSSDKIMFKCAELYIGSNGSTLTNVQNFILAVSDQKPRRTS
jgi:hypothetical protein